MIFVFLIFILTGALAGFLSGLIGIGGGVIVVPCLYYTLVFLGIPQHEMMKIVVGTSLAAIAFSTFISASGHYKKKAILMRPFKRMLPGLIIGSFFGATLGKYIPSHVLKLIFASFEIILGIYFFCVGKQSKSDENTLPKSFGMMVIGTCISGISSLLGFGGGVITVPMLLFFKVYMRKAVGTSAATSFVIASVGTISYLFYGIGTLNMHMTLGYIYLPAAIAICAGSLIAVPLGVELAHKLPTKILKKVFACILVGIGILMFMK